MKKQPYLFLFCAVAAIAFSLTGCSVSTGPDTAPTNFTSIAGWTGSLGQTVHSVVADGTNIFAAAGPDGLLIFSSGLVYMNAFKTNNPALDVVIRTVSGSKYALVANGIYNGKGGTMAINVSDLTNLQLTNYSEYPNLNPVSIVADSVATNYYTADTLAGYLTFTNSWDTLANQTNRRISLGAGGCDIALSGAKIYVAAKTGGVSIVDHVLNTISANISATLLQANAVAVTGSGDGTLLAVGDSLGLVIYALDDPDPSSPRYLGGYYCGTVYDVAVNGNDFYLALGKSGVLKITRTPPSTFTLVKKTSDGVGYYRLFYNSSTGYLYAACGIDGIRVLQ